MFRSTLKKTLLLGVGALLLTTTVACTGNQTAGETIDDAVITSKIEAKMAADPEVSAFKVDVDTNDGMVRLSGTVDDRRAKEEAEDLAKNTRGVKRVRNDITVGKLTTGERFDDAAITAKITARFAADPEVNPFKIDVDTDGGIVTLTGVVESRKVKEEAEQLAEGVDGVLKVKNSLEVKPSS